MPVSRARGEQLCFLEVSRIKSDGRLAAGRTSDRGLVSGEGVVMVVVAQWRTVHSCS